MEVNFQFRNFDEKYVMWAPGWTPGVDSWGGLMSTARPDMRCLRKVYCEKMSAYKIHAYTRYFVYHVTPISEHVTIARHSDIRPFRLTGRMTAVDNLLSGCSYPMGLFTENVCKGPRGWEFPAVARGIGNEGMGSKHSYSVTYYQNIPQISDNEVGVRNSGHDPDVFSDLCLVLKW